MSHQHNEQRSLALHSAVAVKLRRHPELLTKARERVESWIREGPTHPHYAEAWLRLLSSAQEDILERLVDPGETMCALRQCSPFAGVLTPQERWRILREVREQ